jgi:hypothetical protein
MFLVAYPIPHSAEAQLIFCMTDPRDAGYVGPVETGTELEAPNLCDSSWLMASTSRVVGLSPDSPKLYRLFKSADECRLAGFRVIGPMPVVAYRWTEAFVTAAKPLRGDGSQDLSANGTHAPVAASSTSLGW